MWWFGYDNLVFGIIGELALNHRGNMNNDISSRPPSIGAVECTRVLGVETTYVTARWNT